MTRAPRLLAFAMVLVWLVGSASTSSVARAEVDYRPDLALPQWDWAVGVSGGLAFGEDGSQRSMGALGAVDLSLLHGFFGAHLSLRAHPEGSSVRLGAVAEVSWWYLVMVGAGVGVGAMADHGGPKVPPTTVTVTFVVGVPFLLTRLEDGEAGAIVLVPYGRPGLRIGGRDLAGFHEAGLMLKWTTYGF